MGHLFWSVTCALMGKQLNPQPSHLGKIVGKSPPPPPPPGPWSTPGNIGGVDLGSGSLEETGRLEAGSVGTRYMAVGV